MGCESAAAFDAGASDVHDDFEVFGCCGDPGLGKFHSFFFGEHVAFAGGAVDKDAFESVALEHVRVAWNRGEVDFSVFVKGCEGCVDETDYFFHELSGLCGCFK